MMKALTITKELIDEMRESIHYDPQTGTMRWRVGASNNPWAGKEINRVGYKGYLQIRFKGKLYRAHRVAWALHYGVNPPEFLDHINLDPSDNRIANLRPATVAENNRNTKIRANNKSGYKGVHWHKATNKWCAQVRVEGTKVCRLFSNIKEAIVWSATKRQELHGEFSTSKNHESI